MGDVRAFFQGLQRFGITLGLERIRRLLDHLGQPQNRVPAVHVAGTNGKGSVCAYLAHILTACGYRTGLYISPHLVRYQERVQINGQPITEGDWWRILQRIHQVVEAQALSITEFEAITALMWVYFAEQQVDIGVIEVGLGGRLDATNVLDHPLVTVITSIGFDHQERLGPTLADIAREKAGILKPGRPLVRGPMAAAAAAVIDDLARRLACPLVVVEPPDSTPGNILRFQGDDYPIPLLGEHQKQNACIALAIANQLRQQGWDLPVEKVQRGMAQTRWPGRLQWVTWGGQKVLLDGAHNPEGAETLRRYIDQEHLMPVHWVMGLLASKDAPAILGRLLRPGDRVSFVPIPGHAYHEPVALREVSRCLCPDLAVQVYQHVQEAVAATPQGYTPVITGSLYLIGQVLKDRGIS
ncbi:MAG: folylpolyglutamate synthase/dihydrofolate synthase family protein [Gloeomargarita sp. GMQP_bins_120]